MRPIGPRTHFLLAVARGCPHSHFIASCCQEAVLSFWPHWPLKMATCFICQLETQSSSKRDIVIFCNVVGGVISNHHCIIPSIKSKSLFLPTFKIMQAYISRAENPGTLLRVCLPQGLCIHHYDSFSEIFFFEY